MFNILNLPENRIAITYGMIMESIKIVRFTSVPRFNLRCTSYNCTSSQYIVNGESLLHLLRIVSWLVIGHYGCLVNMNYLEKMASYMGLKEVL